MTNQDPKKMKVLVVDDEDVLRMLVGMTIDSVGLEMVEAGSGAEALEILQSQKIAFVITDIVMPGMSGMEFAEIVKNKSPLTDIILVSGNLTNQIEAQAAKLGICAILSKPYDYAEMERVINTAAARAKSL